MELSVPTSPQRKTRRLLRIGCILVVLLLIGAVVIFALSIHTSLEAETSLHLMCLTEEVLIEYCEKHPGRWPSSWEELTRECPKSRDWGGINWPGDCDKIQDYVIINFSEKPETIARQTPESFQALRPAGPSYWSVKYDRGHILEIQESIRRGLAANDQSPK